MGEKNVFSISAEHEFHKELGNALDIEYSGRKSQELHQITDTALDKWEEWKTENSEIIDRIKKQWNTWLGAEDTQFVEERFKEGLANYVLMEYKVRKSVDQNVDELKNPEKLGELTIAYGVNYYRILANCQRVGMTPVSAADVAKEAHRLDFRDPIRLAEQYSEFESWVLVEAMTKHLKEGPNNFLDRVRENARIIAEKHPEIEQWLVLRFAMKRDPEEAIKVYEKVLAEIAADPIAQELPEWMRKQVAGQNLRSAVQKLHVVREVRSKLQEKHPGFSQTVYDNIAFYRPEGAEIFFEEVINKLEQYRRENIFVDAFSESDLINALLSHPKNTEKFLQDCLDRIKDMSEVIQEYEDKLGTSDENRLHVENLLATLSISYPVGGTKRLEQALAKLQEYETKYPKHSRSYIARVLVHNQTNPDWILSNEYRK